MFNNNFYTDFIVNIITCLLYSLFNVLIRYNAFNVYVRNRLNGDSTDIIEANPNGVVRENDAIYMFSQYNMFKYAL